ncbi:hypothetical protein T01_13236 [Trichinella spiralis]|uniref:Uncharacterized protein n=1 Tax=Trichinella spiralis TaxID=6334 RepID=A0A0V1AN56_TRISP|nr:hypothetical protein T01_12504 [Trichinella spiralis]KRY26110.1 hypothetical protein T01_13236 [Trichinella spiralis]
MGMKILAVHERPVYAPWLVTRFRLVKSFRNATDIF